MKPRRNSDAGRDSGSVARNSLNSMPVENLNTEEFLSLLHTETGLLKLQQVGGVQVVCQKLEVDPNTGISSTQAETYRAKYGENRIPEAESTTYCQLIIASLEDFTLRLLLGCAILSIGIALGFQRDEELSWLEGTAIILTVVAVCNIQAIQDWTKERSFRRMNTVSNNMLVPVIRDGKRTDISRYDVVVGDVITINVGDVLEADGILLQGTDVETDESALTGEPEDIKKDVEEVPFLFSGSAVKNGSGNYLATAVGISSVNGKITALVRGQEVQKQGSRQNLDNPDGGYSSENTPPQDGEAAEVLKKLAEEAKQLAEKEAEEEVDEDRSVLRGKLDAMVAKIAYFAFGSAGISTLVMLVRYVIDSHITKKSDWDWKDDPNEILSAVVTGIAIVVVAVPEGLPLAVTLSLSLSMKKMLTDNNLVKHMDATETMGSATTICSDKTGTLTQNRMTVMRTYIGGKEFIAGESKESSCGKLLLKEENANKEVQSLVCANIVATRAEGADIEWNLDADRWNQRGNKTDCATLAFIHDLGVNHTEERANPIHQCTDRSGRPVYGLKMYPFSSARKRSGQVIPLTDDPNGPCRLFLKGASEIVMTLCTTEVLLDGSRRPLDEKRREEIRSGVVEKFAMAAMRTIALAYVDFPTPPDWDEEIPMLESEELTGLLAKTYKSEKNLCFLAILGIIDPIREGVPMAIAQCNHAGVDVRMVTGDHKATAMAIAKDCGILRKGIDFTDEQGEPLVHEFTVMNGDEFRRRVLRGGRLNQAAFDVVWPHLRVLARSSPEDKHTLVSGLCESTVCYTAEGRALGVHHEPQVVAVTGDGTNDAPALRRADVGFAMKITGTRVAQDAADILLMDDNFESVVKACMWGRNVYDSICKFLQFQLTVNVSAVSISLIGACTVKKAPLSVVQMLWVNLIMDSLGALALASELPTEDLLNRKPYGKKKGLLSYCMVWNIAGQSIYQLTVLLLLLFAGAGPACLGDCDPDTFVWLPGGMLNLPSGIGRGHHDAPTSHYTVIFNAFVFMQMFNWINARKLHHELNAFAGIHKNLSFCAIWISCVLVQILMVESAGMGGGSGENMGFKTRSLELKFWALCMILGVFSLIWYVVVASIGKALSPFLMKEATFQEKSDEHINVDIAHPETPQGDLGDEPGDGEREIVPERDSALKLKSVVQGIIWARRLTKALNLNDTASVTTSGNQSGATSGTDRSQPSTISGRRPSSPGVRTLTKSKSRQRIDREIALEFSSATNLTKTASRSGIASGGVRMFDYGKTLTEKTNGI